MAIVSVKPRPKEAFHSIEEITQLVENGKKTLVTGNFKTKFV